MQIELPEKRYYSIGEVAKAFGVNNSLIRFWEKEFDVLRPKKNAKGDRRFTTANIEILKQIFYLVKTQGYTLEGAKKHFKAKKTNPQLEVIERLNKVKSELLRMKNVLSNDDEPRTS